VIDHLIKTSLKYATPQHWELPNLSGASSVLDSVNVPLRLSVTVKNYGEQCPSDVRLIGARLWP